MLAASLLAVAASLPLGVWPSDTGPAAVTVHGIEFYLVDPEDDYSIVAIQPLAAALKRAEPAELQRLAALADKLGADAVLLLGEMPEKLIPEDPDAPLPTTGRYSVAVFVSFEDDEGSEAKPGVPSAWRRHTAHHRRHAAERAAGAALRRAPH